MRRKNDFYPTPAAGTLALLNSEVGPLLRGTILEPCVGAGDMAQHLVGTNVHLLTGDIDSQWPADFHADAQNFTYGDFDWIVTNPPFNCALEIIENLYPQAKCGIAVLLRVTFLEPTIDRGVWFKKHPPTKVLHMPRMSFTGDGKTDSAHACWIIWDKTGEFQPELPNEFVTKEMMSEYTQAAKYSDHRTRPLRRAHE